MLSTDCAFRFCYKPSSAMQRALDASMVRTQGKLGDVMPEHAWNRQTRETQPMAEPLTFASLVSIFSVRIIMFCWDFSCWDFSSGVWLHCCALPSNAFVFCFVGTSRVGTSRVGASRWTWCGSTAVLCLALLLLRLLVLGLLVGRGAVPLLCFAGLCFC
jgi:hypothetical protein